MPRQWRFAIRIPHRTVCRHVFFERARAHQPTSNRSGSGSSYIHRDSTSSGEWQPHGMYIEGDDNNAYISGLDSLDDRLYTSWTVRETPQRRHESRRLLRIFRRRGAHVVQHQRHCIGNSHFHSFAWPADLGGPAKQPHGQPGGPSRRREGPAPHSHARQPVRRAPVPAFPA